MRSPSWMKYDLQGAQERWRWPDRVRGATFMVDGEGPARAVGCKGGVCGRGDGRGSGRDVVRL